ncbi:hypothetical protein HDU78_005344 [Chytriomyces hyalinus]|nr:hypothetical protein HDU78_005344 [Chytriomyces hyalinus]
MPPTVGTSEYFMNASSLSVQAQYVLPLAINLSGSAVYYYTLGNSSLSMIVPITNSLTFAFTILAGILLGEEMGSKDTLYGVALVFVGVLLMLE